MRLTVAGPDAANDVADLDRWLQSAGLSEITSIERQRAPTAPGTQGGEWLPILIAILSTPAVEIGIKKLAECIQTWLKVRKPKLTLTITLQDGRTATISAENAAAIDAAQKTITENLLPNH